LPAVVSVALPAALRHGRIARQHHRCRLADGWPDVWPQDCSYVFPVSKLHLKPSMHRWRGTVKLLVSNSDSQVHVGG
jgi:hypothetical protein